ncbi:MAG: AMP-binding protein [Hyphomicrobiaceae bacterium]|nr:AMP-binding protein [Hyphomicrobiaceae bacterium]
MSAPEPWSDDVLERLGLQRDSGGAVRIVLPAKANIAADTVGLHARGPRPEATALIVDRDGESERWSFAALDAVATRLAAGLRRLGVATGEPVAVHTGQSAETAIAHLAIYKLGAIVVTLSQLYGPDTVRHALGDCGARFVITERAAWAQVGEALGSLSQPPVPILAGESAPRGGHAFADLLATEPPLDAPVETDANQPALLMYTSGSTGLPKGLLHAHRILHAYMPTVRLFYDMELDDPDLVFWTPADWAWVGGLLDLVLPAWAAGQTVVASQHRFDAEWALGFMARHGVTHSFMTPTALKRLAQVRRPRERWPLRLRVVCTGGESLPGEVVRWCEEELGCVCNEFYGLTEFNHLVGNCRKLYPIRPGSMGRAYPGHGTTIVDEHGHELPPGEIGEIVAPADDATLFLGYWGGAGVPESLRLGPWLRTRDLARRDDDGYYWYQGRNDDLIKSAGYRIGPTEVEDVLLRHPAVAEAAVIGLPDAERGQVVTAFIRVAEGHIPDESLVADLQNFVKRNLAAYKFPRRIVFVEAFPLTSSGKIRRGDLRRLGTEGEVR